MGAGRELDIVHACGAFHVVRLTKTGYRGSPYTYYELRQDHDVGVAEVRGTYGQRFLARAIERCDAMGNSLFRTSTLCTDRHAQ